MIALPLSGLLLTQGSYHSDERGAFSRLFCEEAFSPALGDRRVVQMNHSITEQVGSIRGLHYQYGLAAETKIIRCIKGRVFDVAVDIRKGSPTFLQWHGEILSDQDQKTIIIPEGFAHGFQVLQPHSELIYLHTASYQPEYESGLRYDDPTLGVEWPLPATEVSEKDKGHALIDKQFQGLEV